jgi:flavocytochrome c
MEHLEKIEKETKGKRARTINNARVVKLITEKNAVVGVEYVVNGTTHQAYGPVVLATGGFGADFSKDSILAQVRPDLLNLSTTNGEHCTGDGIKMAQDIGANTVDMDFVQVHPTGLVDPSDPNAKVKFLAAEALRGVGGLLLDAHGNRFVNELATRDYVSEVMGRNKGPFRLVLNGKASKEIEWHCKHYVGRGLMKKLSGPELAKEIGVSAEKLAETFRKYNEGAKHNKDEFGKKYFHNLPFDINDTFHVAQVCPLIHYCMGGLQIDIHGQVLSKKDNKPIAGLFAAGEVTGGVHIKNRLGGSSLTDCVVYGRIAGGTAAAYLFNQLCAGTPLAAAGEPVELNIKLSPSRKTLTLNINYASSTGEQQQQAPAQQEEAAPAAAAAPAPAKPKELKTYTLEEVAKHNKENDVWVVVNGVVLDVTEFKKRHPGGAKAIMLYAGKDATEEFNMLHDANVIEKYAPETIVGTLASSPKAKL